MSAFTKIEWCDSTFNPVIGCTKISPACAGCYAEVSTPARAMKIKWGAGEARHRTAPSTWAQPLAWNKAHEKFFAVHGRRRRVFCASLADVFDNQWDPAWRADLLMLIRSTPNLDWLLLTKRIGNAHQMIGEALITMTGDTSLLPSWPWPNVWLGATVVNQQEADRDIPKLLAVPAAKRFLSMEPLLGPVDITEHLWGRPKPCWDCPKDADCMCGYTRRGFFTSDAKLDWVIAGGESGPGARPAQLQWFRSVVKQCRAAGVPVMMKQLGGVVLDDGMSSPGEHWPTGTVRNHHPRHTEFDPGFSVRLKERKGGDITEWPEDLQVREFPK